MSLLRLSPLGKLDDKSEDDSYTRSFMLPSVVVGGKMAISWSR